MFLVLIKLCKVNLNLLTTTYIVIIIRTFRYTCSAINLDTIHYGLPWVMLHTEPSAQCILLSNNKISQLYSMVMDMYTQYPQIITTTSFREQSC